MEYTILSLRKNPKILGLFLKGQEYQPSVSRVDFFNQAIEHALSSQSNWKNLSGVTLDYPKVDASTPQFFQLKVDKNKWNRIVDEIKNSFYPPLKRTTAPYAVKLVLTSYLQYLSNIQKGYKENAADHHMDEAKTRETELSKPEMAKILCEMMLTDYECNEMREIRKLMLDWRNDTNGNDNKRIQKEQ